MQRRFPRRHSVSVKIISPPIYINISIPIFPGIRHLTFRLSFFRVQDVRATERDKVKIYNSFRPGDIVRAQVISLGDARSYYLSTAQNELGVIFAKSVAGETMIPVSWQEMQCPKTKVIEYRKCAKPF
jgi:exosome complex component CSL4